MDEFRLIFEYLDRNSDARDIAVGIGDDGAVINVEAGQQVQVLDSLVAGVHFPRDMPAADIAWRAVAVNLSDLAAMGATPRWMTLGLTLSNADERWVRDFSAGLFEAAREFGVALVGGDTTRGPAIVVTVARTGVMATVTTMSPTMSTTTASTKAPSPLLRSGARVGDTIYVTGTLGDAAGGLALYQDGAPCSHLWRRFSRPTPRLAEGQALLGIATAAIDISDGLASDIAKLLDASGVGGEIDLERIPLSRELAAQFDIERCRDFALTGGDDYELCFTAAPGLELSNMTEIGSVIEGDGLVCRLDGKLVAVDTSGYRHFHD